MYDILIFSETWLLSNHLDSEILDEQWLIFRKDRYLSTSRGGGVLIAGRKSYKCTSVTVSIPNHVEQVWSRIYVNGRYVYLGCLYIPPRSDKSLYTEHLAVIEKVIVLMKPTDNMFLFGDFNLPNVQWLLDADNYPCYTHMNASELESFVIDSLLVNGLNQVSGISNDNDRFLDLLFTDAIVDFELSSATVPVCNKFRNSVHHKAMFLEIFFFFDNVFNQNHCNSYYYDFNSADFVSINLKLNDVNWSFLNDETELDFKLEIFYSILRKVIDEVGNISTMVE